MKRTLMVSVAALALAEGSTIAMSQGNSGRGEGGGANAPMNNPAGASGGATGQLNESPAPRRGAQQDRAIPEKQQKSTQQAPDGAQAPATRQTQGERDKSAPTTRQSQGEQDKSGTKSGTTQQTQSPSATGTKQGTAGTQSGAMRTSNVSLTTEQKTTIRSKVLTGSAPRVTSVNFDIRIGTVVPRSVRLVTVPATLVEIEPQWRGYRYFVYHDEIIIVEPRTLEIVYVLTV